MSEDKKNLTREELEKEIVTKAQTDENFRKDLMEKPHEALLTHFGIAIPEEDEIKVVEESSKVLYLVLPVNPDELTDELSDGELSKVAAGQNQGQCVTGPFWVSACSSNCIFGVPGGCNTGPYWVSQCSSNCLWSH